MKTYVTDLKSNDAVESFFLIVDAPQVRKSKKGSDYASFVLIDKTGKIDGRLWEIPAGLDASTLKKTIVKIRGTVSEWNDQSQVSVSQIRPITEADGVDRGDFFEKSEHDPNEMFGELMGIVDDVEDAYIRELVSGILLKHEDKFKVAPAAKSIHHNFLGGLLEHTLSLCRTALAIVELYDLNKDLMVAACCLHDFGKTEELTYDMGIGYSLSGTLLGHIVVGLNMVSEEISLVEGFPQQTKIAILHLIASHHSLLAYGSPKIPLMKEAIAFSMIDNLDAKLAICDKAIKKGVDAEGLTEWVKELEGPIWRGPWQAL